jgi:hypothetical protein
MICTVQRSRLPNAEQLGVARSAATRWWRNLKGFGTPGKASRTDAWSRSHSAKIRVAMLGMSALVASFWARASAACQAPVDTFANPFSMESAHHRPIGGGAVFADTNHPSTISLLTSGFGNINSNNGWGINVYESTSADPLLTVTHAGPYNSIGLPVTLRVPQNANNMLTTDAVVVIHDTTSNTTHEFYYWRWNNGEPTAAIHRQWDTKGLGHSQPGGPRVGTSAAGVAGMFGLLRGHEVNTPDTRFSMPCKLRFRTTNKAAGRNSRTRSYGQPPPPIGTVTAARICARVTFLTARCSPCRRARTSPASA